MDDNRVRESADQLHKSHEARLVQVVQALPLFTADLNQLFVKSTKGDEDLIPTRMQLIGIFTIIDVLSNYWSEYRGVTGTPSGRFYDFMAKFCFNEENTEYKNRRFLGDMTLEKLYDLRNGLVHFYGLSTRGVSVLLNPSKDISDEDNDAWCKNIRLLAKEKNMGAMDFVQPYELKKITIESAALLLEHIQDQEGASPKNFAHIEGIARIALKLQKEGAVVISKDQAEKLNERFSSGSEITSKFFPR